MKRLAMRTLSLVRASVAKGAERSLGPLAETLDELDAVRPLRMPVPVPWLLAALKASRRIRGARDTCLFRSLAAYGALRRLGHRPGFVLGVRSRDGTLEAHAWIELDGHPPDPHADAFTRIFEHRGG
ncbi:MAG: lasso peptide biosynthesis B2 protein [Myxococcota bacterium]